MKKALSGSEKPFIANEIIKHTAKKTIRKNTVIRIHHIIIETAFENSFFSVIFLL